MVFHGLCLPYRAAQNNGDKLPGASPRAITLRAFSPLSRVARETRENCSFWRRLTTLLLAGLEAIADLADGVDEDGLRGI